jgi:hypothetical protein
MHETSEKYMYHLDLSETLSSVRSAAMIMITKRLHFAFCVDWLLVESHLSNFPMGLNVKIREKNKQTNKQKT